MRRMLRSKIDLQTPADRFVGSPLSLLIKIWTGNFRMHTWSFSFILNLRLTDRTGRNELQVATFEEGKYKSTYQLATQFGKIIAKAIVCNKRHGCFKLFQEAPDQRNFLLPERHRLGQQLFAKTFHWIIIKNILEWNSENHWFQFNVQFPQIFYLLSLPLRTQSASMAWHGSPIYPLHGAKYRQY